MNKHLFLISNSINFGKEYLEHCAFALCDFLQGIKTIVFIPFAAGYWDEYESVAKKPFKAMGIQCNSLHRVKNYKKAIQEARILDDIYEVASSESANFNYIPKGYDIPEDYDYFHCTSNNTIFGTQIKSFPTSPIPMVCDMSSDIFSRVLDFSKFDLIYAGAQKNMGPAGTTLVVIKEDILGKVSRKVPAIMDYKLHISNGSMYNTPPVFAVYTSMLTLEWIKKLGGVAKIEELNEKKAQLMYSEIDLNPLFKGFSTKEDRSIMNATFTLQNENLKETFETMLKEAGISGLSGHRSVGGYRASMYNALPIDSVKVLVEVMSELESKA